MISKANSKDPIDAFRGEPKDTAANLPPLRELDTSTWPYFAPPEPNWLLRNLLAAGETGCLAGRSNCGKGLLSLQLAATVATGRGLYGREGCGQGQVVLYVELEDSEEELQRRFSRLNELLRLEPDWSDEDQANLQRNLIFLVPEWKSEKSKTLPNAAPIIRARCKTLDKEGRKVGLIVLDTLAALSEGDENSVEAQRNLWPSCYAMRDESGACVLVVHHTRKVSNGGKPPRLLDRLSFDSLRGSTAIVAGARFILQMEPLSAAEAGKLELDEDKAQRGGYVVLGLTKVVSGPKGEMLLLEQLEGLGGGFWAPHPRSAQLVAQLQSSGAVARLTLAEAVLQSIAAGVTDRKTLARNHWPDQTDTKALASLKGLLNHLRHRHGWLEAGASMNLTPVGNQHARGLLRGQQDTAFEDQ